MDVVQTGVVRWMVWKSEGRNVVRSSFRDVDLFLFLFAMAALQGRWQCGKGRRMKKARVRSSRCRLEFASVSSPGPCRLAAPAVQSPIVVTGRCQRSRRSARRR